MSNEHNLKGKKFGRLIAHEPTQKRDERSIVWKCFCDCPHGNVAYVSCRNLISGNTKSCGCLKRENKGDPRFLEMVKQKRESNLKKLCSIKDNYDRSIESELNELIF